MNANSATARYEAATAPTFTSLSLNECFPLAQPPSSSTDVIGFSCHNVLQVCTRWIVYLYLSNSLDSHAAEIVPRLHPLCHFNEKTSVELVLGAKWSSTLVPEVRYPAESRLCVMTTSSLIVYRVVRHGDTRIQPSHGIGIATTRLLRCAEESKGEAMDASRKGTERPLGKSRTAVKARTKAARRKPAPKTTKKRGPTKRKRSSSDDDDSSLSSAPSSSSSASSSSSEPGSDSDADSSHDDSADSAPRTRTRAAATSSASGPVQEEATLLDVAWLPDDLLVVLTTIGLHVMPFEHDSSDDETAIVRRLPEPSHAFASDVIGADAAPPSCLSVVQTSPLVHGTSSGDAFATHLVVVSSAFVSRVFVVNKDHVTLLHYVEVPMITSVPSCVCALLETSTEASHGGTRTRPSTSSAEITLLLASPSATLCGTFTATVQNDPKDTKAPAKTKAGVTPAVAAPTPALFTLRHVYHDLAGPLFDPFIRGFQVTPVTSVKDANVTTAPFLVFALAHRAYYGLLLNSPAITTLFRCASLVTSDTVPPSSAVAVCGLATHPSAALAVGLFQTGYTHYPPLHLLPISAGDVNSPLHRQLSLTGTFNGILEQHPNMAEKSAASRSNMYFQWLWQHQRDPSFFVWEPLFTLSTACTALHSYVDGRKYLTNKKAFLRELNALLSRDSRGATLQTQLPETCALRAQYCRLRDQWGVELFLRWPAPLDTSWSHWHGTTNSGGGVGEPQWWHLLLQLWRQQPWDPSPMAELTLANAVRVLAASTHYAQTTLRDGETVRRLDDRCATSASTLSVESALCFVQLYIQQLALCQPVQRNVGGGEDVGASDALFARPVAYTMPMEDAPDNGATRCEKATSLLPWAATPAWGGALRTFLNQVDKAAAQRPQKERVHTGADMATVRFPCSVCDAPDVATFNLTFRCSSTHPPYAAEEGDDDATRALPAETHMTLFSGTTFSPLSLFCEDCVLTRCLGCGFADYATGPLCRLCGGLLL